MRRCWKMVEKEPLKLEESTMSALKKGDIFVLKDCGDMPIEKGDVLNVAMGTVVETNGDLGISCCEVTYSQLYSLTRDGDEWFLPVKSREGHQFSIPLVTLCIWERMGRDKPHCLLCESTVVR